MSILKVMYRILNHFRRENKVGQIRFFETTPTRYLNSFKHFSRPKNKTLRSLNNTIYNDYLIEWFNNMFKVIHQRLYSIQSLSSTA